MFLDAFAFLLGSLECPATSLVKRREISGAESSEGGRGSYVQDASKREEMPLYRTGLSSRYSANKWTFTAKEQSEGQWVDNY